MAFDELLNDIVYSFCQLSFGKVFCIMIKLLQKIQNLYIGLVFLMWVNVQMKHFGA